MTTDHSTDERLLRPYRVMRRISPPEHPWNGLLVRSGEESVVFVPSDEVGEDWPGWGARPEGHVVAPIDIVRRRAGHDVVMAPCPHRLADVIARRRDDGRPLDAGEAVTVAVSVLRGVGELQSLDPRTSGEWWITDGGMPVLASGAAFARSGAHDGAEILRAMLPCEPSVDAALEDAYVALETPQIGARSLIDIESRLFASATPEPLAISPLTPHRVRTVDSPAFRPDDTAESRRGLFARLVHHVDDDLADVVSVATTAAWRGLTRRRVPGSAPRRRRPLLVGAAIAGVVVAGGLLWPGDEDRRPAEAAPIAVSTTPAPPPDDALTVDDDLAAVTARLLTQRSECEGDATCLAEVVEDPSAVHPDGVIDLDASRRSVTLLDEFGGAAVLRVDATRATDAHASAQFVVIVTREGEWLIRDVHDVADQP